MSEILNKIRELGIQNPESPSVDDLKIILNAYIKDKSLDVDTFKAYTNLVSLPLKAMLEGLKTFSETQRDVSVKVLDIINNAVKILENELNREISYEERREIRAQIFELIDAARNEAREQRESNWKYAKMAVGAVVICVGFTVFAFTKNKEVMQRGVEMLKGI